MTDVISHVNRKLIHRHPHVWGDVEAKNAGEVLANWDALKKKEHAEQGIQRESILDGIPKGIPALMQALRYQEKAAKVHFDWDTIEPVIAKVREELDEVLTATDDDNRAEEIGDLLFVIANWARWLKIDPETALRETNAKFYRRFRYVEDGLAVQGKTPAQSNLAEMDVLWDQAKAAGL